MNDQARAGIEKLESLTSDARILDPLRAALEAAVQPPAESEPEMAEINADEPSDFAIELDTQPESEVAVSPDLAGYDHQVHDEIHDQAPAEATLELTDSGTHQVEPAHAEPVHAELAQEETGELTALVADLEASLGDSFPQASPLPAPPAKTQAPVNNSPAAQPLPSWPAPAAPKRAAAPPSRKPEPEPVVHMEIPAAMPAIATSKGGAAAAPAMSYSPSTERPLGAGAQAMHASDSVDLSEMFGELKQELEEEVAAGDDDPETHYNLGVAFREMGLLDEAIAELQKVCNSIERGKPFSQPVQTYTWLAQCFLDKGVPEAAIRWYEKALGIQGLDDEARVAINYELGSACETAQDKTAALRYFTNVYGANIDYRDVSERIQALKS
jgi:hypothetical protein